MEKTNQLPAQEAGEAAYWGTQLEAIVSDEFTKRTGIEVRQVKQLLQSEEHPFMLANLDGITAIENFISGFRLGVRLMVDCMEDDDGNVTDVR